MWNGEASVWAYPGNFEIHHQTRHGNLTQGDLFLQYLFQAVCLGLDCIQDNTGVPLPVKPTVFE
jgi:hypothetical protein